MAKSGRVVLRGRFSPGARVRLVEVADAGVLRAAGGREVDSGVVGDDGCVEFDKGVSVGGRYFIVGQQNGFPLEVRVTGREAGEESAEAVQAPVGLVRTRLAGGGWSDEVPEAEEVPGLELAPGASQAQAREAGVVQRSATPLGYATPVDPEEQLPYTDQANVAKGTVQASDTPVGRATPVSVSPAVRQEDVPGDVVQRSATKTGVATPIPAGDAVEAHRWRESAEAKTVKGEPVQAAARPADAKGGTVEDGVEPAHPDSQADLEDEDDGELKGDALTERARELDIEGRSTMTADELREAVAKAEKG